MDIMHKIHKSHKFIKAILAMLVLLTGAGMANAEAINEIIISNATCICGGCGFNEYTTVVAYDNNSNVYLVVWVDTRAGDYNIVARLINATTLEFIGNEIVVTTNTSGQYNPSVAYSSADNKFIITWIDYRNGNYDIYARTVTSSGTL